MYEDLIALAEQIAKIDAVVSRKGERIRYFQDQVSHLRKVEVNPVNYRLSASGFLAEIDRMQLEVREHLSVPAGEVAEGVRERNGRDRRATMHETEPSGKLTPLRGYSQDDLERRRQWLEQFTSHSLPPFALDPPEQLQWLNENQVGNLPITINSGRYLDVNAP